MRTHRAFVLLACAGVAACVEPKTDPSIGTSPRSIDDAPSASALSASAPPASASPASASAEAVAPPNAEAAGSQSQSCKLPKNAKGLVLEIERWILPHGGPDQHVAGAVTSDGKCPANWECFRLDAAKMKALVDQTLALGVLRTKPQKTSPHYGGRYTRLTWDGGSCEWRDSSQAPLVDEDRDRFRDAQEAVGDAIIARRGTAPKP